MDSFFGGQPPLVQHPEVDPNPFLGAKFYRESFLFHGFTQK